MYYRNWFCTPGRLDADKLFAQWLELLTHDYEWENVMIPLTETETPPRSWTLKHGQTIRFLWRFNFFFSLSLARSLVHNCSLDKVTRSLWTSFYFNAKAYTIFFLSFLKRFNDVCIYESERRIRRKKISFLSWK